MGALEPSVRSVSQRTRSPLSSGRPANAHPCAAGAITNMACAASAAGSTLVRPQLTGSACSANDNGERLRGARPPRTGRDALARCLARRVSPRVRTDSCSSPSTTTLRLPAKSFWRYMKASGYTDEYILKELSLIVETGPPTDSSDDDACGPPSAGGLLFREKLAFARLHLSITSDGGASPPIVITNSVEAMVSSRLRLRPCRPRQSRLAVGLCKRAHQRR